MGGLTGSSAAASPGAYRREDVCRIVKVSERQLKSWERQGFVEPGPSFGFSDLLALKTLKQLKQFDIAPRQIREAIESLKRRLGDVDRPLAQLRITAEGRKIMVHVAGNRMEPITGQLLLDFDSAEIEKLRSFPARETAQNKESNSKLAELWFQRGLALEEIGAPIEDAVAAYKNAIAANPNSSGALVNLGTISFRMRKFQDASAYYTRAIESDPGYALAHFNLGNLHDEQGNGERARYHYLQAVRLNPRYGDAIFNLALLCERNNDVLQAIAYWQAYLKLDPASSWSQTARKQLAQLKTSVRSK